jgi:hypothetical protein
MGMQSSRKLQFELQGSWHSRFGKIDVAASQGLSLYPLEPLDSSQDFINLFLGDKLVKI